MDVHDIDARSLAAALRRGDLSPVEVVDHTLTAAEALNETLGAFATIAADLAQEQAKAAEQTLVAARRSRAIPTDGSVAAHDTKFAGNTPPFLGVPCPIKDLNAVAGVPFGAGSRAFAGFVPPYDDSVVTLLRNAGTIMIGKTTTPEFGLPCYTEPDTSPPARTPWDLSRSAGGSSGGAAAAVAAGIVPVAQGSDGGGSLRIPASACGVVALKPTRGRISMGPAGVDGAGLASYGMLTRTVRDTAAFLDILARPFPGEPYPLPAPASTYLSACDQPLPPLRIGVITTPLISADAPVDPACKAAVQAVAQHLAGQGHHLVDLTGPFPAEQWDSFMAVWAIGALRAPVPPADEHLLVPLTRWLRDQGRQVTGLDLAIALDGLQMLTRQVAAAWANVDIIMSPTLAQLPAPVGAQRNDADPAADFAAQKAFTPWTSLYNITGWPAISLPLHEAQVTARDGAVALPVGVMFGAHHGREDLLLTLAAALEESMPWAQRQPPTRASATLPTTSATAPTPGDPPSSGTAGHHPREATR